MKIDRSIFSTKIGKAGLPVGMGAGRRRIRNIILLITIGLLLCLATVDIIRHVGMIRSVEPIGHFLRREGYNGEFTRECYRPAYKIGYGAYACNYHFVKQDLSLSKEEARNITQRLHGEILTLDSLEVSDKSPNPRVTEYSEFFSYSLSFSPRSFGQRCSVGLQSSSYLYVSCDDTSILERIFRSLI